MSTTFTIPKANSMIFTPIQNPSDNLFFQTSSQGCTLSTGGQAADTHYNIERSADGSNGLCSSVSIQEVYTEDLNLGEGHATQQSVQHLSTATGVIAIKSLFERGLQPNEGKSRTSWGWYSHTLVCPCQSPKRMKNTSDNSDALCICRNGFGR